MTAAGARLGRHRGLLAVTVAVATLATGCARDLRVAAEDCAAFGVAFASAGTVDEAERLRAVRDVAARWPDEPLAPYVDAYEKVGVRLAEATEGEAVFLAALDAAVVMHDVADVPPIQDAGLIEAIRVACDDVRFEVLAHGPDGRTPEPEETVGFRQGGTVDAFVASLTEAHRRTDGQGCAVLREGLAIDVAANAAPHLAADAMSGEIGCVFTDPSGPVLLVLVALDGEVPSRLAPAVQRPGTEVGLEDVFGMARARGYAAFDATSDGWLLALTPGDPAPRDALLRLADTLG